MILKTAKEVNNFFYTQHIFDRLMSIVVILTKRNDVALTLAIGGSSFTDGKVMRIGLPEFMVGRDDKEILSMLKGLVAHESEHIRSSSFTAFSAFRKKTETYYFERHHIAKKYGDLIGQYIANSVEDGRIEKLASNRYRGYKRTIQFMNSVFWKEIKSPNSPLHAFLGAVVSISTIGYYPQEFVDKYKNTEIKKQVDLIINDIMDGINERTPVGALDVCQTILDKSEDFLVKLLQDLSQEDEDFLDSLNAEPEFTTSDPEPYDGDLSVSTHLVPEDSHRTEQPKQEQGETNNENKKTNENQKKGNAGKQKEKDQEKENTGDTSSNSKNKEKSSDTGESTSDKTDSSKESQSANQSEKSPTKDQRPSTEFSNDVNGKRDDSDLTPIDEEKIRAQMEEITDEEVESARKVIEESRLHPKKNPKEIKEHLDAEEVKSIESKYENQRIRRFKEINGLNRTYPLPQDIQKEGKKFRIEIERLLRNKEAMTLRGQRKGVLDQSNLWRVGGKDFNVFVQKGVPSTTDYVAYILQDGSGSMNSDQKQFLSARALAILEEGLKGIIPFKVTTFSVDASENAVIHYMVKGFNDNEMNKSYTYSFHRSRKANGGNKDGFSVRVATQELLNRPERDRILIVLSDGLPSDYPSTNDALNDVKEAVKEARRKGIIVISMLFGSPEFRMFNMDNFRKIYEKNIVSADPQELTRFLIQVFKRILER